ncbi:MAG: Rrf2 family transcriptional regulator [Candidatus Omnitrophota bacterium]
MKLITRDTDYAIRSMCFIIERRKERIVVDDLVDELRMPKPFLRKILQVLNKEKLLRSYKGKGGGFVLAADPVKISLLDMIEIFQGRLKLNQCTFKKQLCPNTKTCKVKKKIDGIQKYVKRQLKSVSLLSLVKKGK